MMLSEFREKIKWGAEKYSDLPLHVSSFALKPNETFLEEAKLFCAHIKELNENRYIITDMRLQEREYVKDIPTLIDLLHVIDLFLEKFGDGEVRTFSYNYDDKYIDQSSQNFRDFTIDLDSGCIYSATIEIQLSDMMGYNLSMEKDAVILADYKYDEIETFLKTRTNNFIIKYS